MKAKYSGCSSLNSLSSTRPTMYNAPVGRPSERDMLALAKKPRYRKAVPSIRYRGSASNPRRCFRDMNTPGVDG